MKSFRRSSRIFSLLHLLNRSASGISGRSVCILPISQTQPRGQDQWSPSGTLHLVTDVAALVI